MYRGTITFLTVIAASLLFSATNIYSNSTVPLPYQDVGITSTNDTAQFTGSPLSGDVGKPNLPKYSVTLLLPPNADINSIVVSIENELSDSVSGEYIVTPALPPTIRGEIFWPEELNIVDNKDVDVYGKDELFPKAFLGKSSSGLMDEYVLVEVEVYPFRYNPITKKMVQLKGGVLTVNYTESVSANGGLSNKINRTTKNAMKSIVANYSQNANKYKEPVTINTTGAVLYVMTTQNIVNGSKKFSSFINSKKAKGFNVTVVTETQWGGGKADAAANNLRNYLKTNYQSKNIEYVLLIGDPHPDSGTLPMKQCFPRNNSTYYPQYKDAPTDFYYADLSGNWDLDKDGKYGEFGDDTRSGGADKYSEVIVGRIPCEKDYDILDEILEKIMQYESSSKSESSWRNNVLLPMKPSDASTPGYHYAEQIRNKFLIPNNIPSHRIYESNYGKNPETTPCNISNVTNVWKNGKFGYNIWWTHGNQTFASDIMSSSKARELNDNYPSHTFQVSCLNGYPENRNNLGFELLKNGAISTVSASRVSWYWQGQTNFEYTSTNTGMGYEYTRRFITEGKNAGEALALTRSTLNPSQDYMWMNWLVFNLYGDPTVGLYSDTPDEFIKVNTPKIHDEYGEKDTINITWSSTGVDYFEIQLSLDSGKTYEVIGNVARDSSLIQIAPKLNAPYCKVIVSDINSSLKGESDFFSISDTIIPLISISIFDTLDEDNSLDIDVMGSYINGGYDDFEIVDPALHGVIEKKEGLLNFTPDMDFFGKDSFSYRYLDNRGRWSGKAWCVLQVDPVNDAPKLNFKAPDVWMSSEEIDTSINVSNMFYDPDSNSMFYQVQNSQLIFSDEFALGKLNSNKWISNAEGTINGIGEPSESYSIEFMTGDSAKTVPFDLKGYISCKIVFDWERQGTTKDAPGINDDVVFEYFTEKGVWKEFERINHDQGAINSYTNIEADLDVDALHENFQVRITRLGNTGSYFVDNFKIIGGAYSDFASILADGSLMINPPSSWFGDKEIIITAIDETGLVSYDTLTLNVNKKPVANSASYELNEDTEKKFAMTGQDEDGKLNVFEIVDSPKHGAISGTVPNVTYKPSSNYFGKDSMSFRVKDDINIYSNTSWIHFNVLSVNDKPYFTSKDTMYTVEGIKTTYKIEYIDNDDVPTMKVTNLPNWVTLVDNVVSCTPSSTDINGFFDVSIDDGKLSTSKRVYVSVQHKPQITSTPLATSLQGSLYNYQLVVIDKEDNTFNYQLLSYPQGMTISSTGKISWTPQNSDSKVGTFDIKVKASDKGTPTLFDEQSYTLVVDDKNDAPQFITKIDTLFVNLGDSLIKLIEAEDIDDTLLTYTVISGNGLTLLNNNKGVTIHWRATSYANNNITLKVEDPRGLSDETSFVIAVNNAPIAYDVFATLNEDEMKTVSFNAIDNDGFIVSYEITQPHNGSAIIVGNSISYSPYNDFYGKDTLFYKAKDNRGIWSEYGKFIFDVINIDDEPVFKSATTIYISEGTRLEYDVVIEDIDNTPLVTIVTKPSWIDGTSKHVFGNPGHNDKDTVIVLNISSGSYNENRTVYVNIQHAPEFVNAPTITATQDVAYSYNAVATDSDGDKIVYALKSAPVGMTISASGMIRWIPINSDALKGAHSITVTATDNGSPILTTTLTYTINVTNINDEPEYVELKSYEITMDSGTVFNKKFYAFDIDNDEFTVSKVSGPDCIVNVQPNYLELTWDVTTPSPAVFVLKVTDTKGAYSQIAYQINVNLVPKAIDSAYTLNEDSYVNFMLEGVDRDGTINEYKIIQYPTKGTLFRVGPNVYYTPGADISGLDSLTYIVKDNNNSWSKEAKIKLTINEINDLPVIYVGNTIYVTDRDGLFKIIHVIDPDGVPTVTIDNLPAWLDFSNGVLSGTPTATDFSTSITIKANDGSNTVSKVINMIVLHTPKITTEPLTFGTEEKAYVYDLDADDVDNDYLYYTLVSAPVGMQINSTTGEITWIPTNKDAMSDSTAIEVQVRDIYDPKTTTQPVLTAFQTYKIYVNNVNDAPEFIEPNHDISFINEGDLYSMEFEAIDIDDPLLAFSLVNGPSGMTINSSAKKVKVTFPAIKYGNETFTLKVEDPDGLYDLLTYTIHINSVPTAKAKNYTTKEEVKINIIFEGEDVDGVINGYIITKITTNGALRFINFNTIEYTPKLNFYGVDSLFYAAKDNLGAISDPARIFITVEAVNDTPVILSTDHVDVKEGDLFTYKAIVKDNDDTPEITFENLPNWIKINGVILTAAVTHEAEDFSFNVVAKDKYLTIKKTVTVNIDHTPIITSKPITAATQDVIFSYPLTIDEKDGDQLLYKLVSGPAGMMISTTGVISWTPTNTQALGGKFDVNVSVEDKTVNKLTNTQFFTVNVTNVNDAPEFTLTPAEAYTIKTLESFTTTLNAQDIDGDAITLSATGLPAGATSTINENAITFSYTNAVEGVYTVLFTATDAGGLFDTFTLTLTVQKPLAISKFTPYAKVGYSVAVGPNPFIEMPTVFFTIGDDIEDESIEATIKVYTANERLISSVTIDATPGENSITNWYQLEKLIPGRYYFILEVNGETKVVEPSYKSMR